LIQPPVDAAAFIHYLLQKGIMVRNAEALGAAGLVRITVGTPEMNQALTEAISSLLFCKSSGLSIKGS
jgi:histidinol-phosphate/aromatic aminotransferase/cobyric acid decarboxylase-like protein